MTALLNDTILEAVQEQLQFISEGGSVLRYHARPGIRPDTDAQHSHGVAMLCYLIWTYTHSKPISPNLLMAALTHDLGEQVASDVSAPSKRLLGIRDQLQALEDSQLSRHGLEFTSRLTEEEHQILKMSDYFDGMLYCTREIAIGNKNVFLIYRRYSSYIETLPLNPICKTIFNAIKNIFEENSVEPKYDCFAEI